MTKWKYPKTDSFIVDMNNPPPKSKEKIQDAITAVEETKPTITKAKNETPIPSSSIYYPSKSPYSQQARLATMKHQAIIDDKLSRRLAMGLLVAILIIASFLYFILLGVVVKQGHQIDEMDSNLAKMEDNLANLVATPK